MSIKEISSLLNIKLNTLNKAIANGTIYLPNDSNINTKPTTKTERNIIDSNQSMGKSCVNTVGRFFSSQTGIPCSSEFKSCIDVSYGGILLALPSLLVNNLLKYIDRFKPDTGYYSITHIFLSLAFLFLHRIKTLSQSSYLSCGDLGKTLGLDRIPEVKTLRERIALFCERADIKQWSGALSKDWMESFPDLSGALYIDGHVNLYYGHSTNMPKRYVSRLKLCLNGSTDYWVNDMTGQPFFVINKTINNGMIQIIKEDIIPKLNTDVPNQPTMLELEANKHLHRYMLVSDRECYSPDFFYDLWEERIAICTYNKNVKDKWDDSEFTIHKGQLPNGEVQEILLAERGILIQNGGSSKKIWGREIRKKSESGHQTSIITTNYMLSTILIGLYMFARWSQENFFKYMMENFGIDNLTSYLKEEISDTTILVNPKYRELEAKQKKLVSKLNIRKAKFATMEIGDMPIKENYRKSFLEKKAELVDIIKALEEEIEQIKTEKKATPRKICFAELDEKEKFNNVINQRKQFLDTIKIIAYRAETAMVNLIKPQMGHADEARKLLQQIYKTDANIYPDQQNKQLIIEIHSLSYYKNDKVLKYLCEELNSMEIKYPDTDMVLKYKMVSSENP